MPNAASPFWWSAALAAIASLANLGLLVFAGVQVWREWKRDDRRIAAAAAQASNLGYLLRLVAVQAERPLCPEGVELLGEVSISLCVGVVGPPPPLPPSSG